MGELVVVGSVVRNWWWEDQPVNRFRRMGRRWVGWQRQWVGVWDVVGGGGCVLILVVFFLVVTATIFLVMFLLLLFFYL